MATHSDEERQNAIALVAEHGLAYAWRETGIPKPTIVRWCKAAGVERFHPEKTRMAVEALQERAATLRESLRLKLLEKVDDLLDRMDAEHVDFKGKDSDEVVYPIAPAAAVQNYATSVGILIDKYRLEIGEATGRTESWTNDHADHEARDIAEQIRAELASRARRRVEADAEPAAMASDSEDGATTA
jgi:transposase-like protein